MMKKAVIVLFGFAVLLLSAGERQELKKVFEKEDAAAEKIFQNAVTTVEMTAGAGNLMNSAEKQLLRALDYKLRHTKSSAERLKILANFQTLSKVVQKTADTPRKGMGSQAGMQIYHRIANLLQQQRDILLLDSVSAERWEKIANAVLVLNGKEISLEQGKAAFETLMHNMKVTLEILLFPKDTFSCSGRDYAIIRTDIPFAGNNDFAAVYLCELKNGKLLVHTKM